MGRIDIAICLKKRNKDSENINKIIMREKNNFFNHDLIVFALIFSYAHSNK